MKRLLFLFIAAAACVLPSAFAQTVIPWTDVSKSGSNLTDLATRNVYDLQGLSSYFTDTATINFTHDGTAHTLVADVIRQMSITADANGLKLSGDSASPGNNKVYGTDGSGVKGWKSDPAAGGLSDGTFGDIVVSSSGTVMTVGNSAITLAKVAAALKPSGSAATTDESLRALGNGTNNAAPGDDARFPTSTQKSALVGTDGTPGSGNKYVTDSDARNSNARTPSAHATSHKTGGSDSIKIDELAAPTDVTTLNVSSSAHGLMPKADANAAHFYSSDGTQKTPTASQIGLGNVDNTSNATERAAAATLTNKRITARVNSVSYGSTVTPDADSYDVYNIGALTGNITLGAPTGTPTDGQQLRLRMLQDGTGGRTTTFNSAYAFGTDVTAALVPTTANAKYELLFQWFATDSKWRCVGIVRGF